MPICYHSWGAPVLIYDTVLLLCTLQAGTRPSVCCAMRHNEPTSCCACCAWPRAYNDGAMCASHAGTLLINNSASRKGPCTCCRLPAATAAAMRGVVAVARKLNTTKLKENSAVLTPSAPCRAVSGRVISAACYTSNAAADKADERRCTPHVPCADIRLALLGMRNDWKLPPFASKRRTAQHAPECKAAQSRTENRKGTAQSCDKGTLFLLGSARLMCHQK